MEQHHFIQSPIYSKLIDAIREAGLQVAIEEAINNNPKRGKLLGGGIHKLRVASTKRREGTPDFLKFRSGTPKSCGSPGGFATGEKRWLPGLVLL